MEKRTQKKTPKGDLGVCGVIGGNAPLSRLGGRSNEETYLAIQSPCRLQ